MGSSGPCAMPAKTEEEEAMVGKAWRSAEVAVAAAGDVRGEEGSRWRTSVLNLRSAGVGILGSTTVRRPVLASERFWCGACVGNRGAWGSSV